MRARISPARRRTQCPSPLIVTKVLVVFGLGVVDCEGRSIGCLGVLVGMGKEGIVRTYVLKVTACPV